MKHKNKLAADLYRRRIRNGHTYAHIGREIGCSGKSVGAWEAGDARPRDAYWSKLAAYLGVELAVFKTAYAEELGLNEVINDKAAT